MKKENNPNYYVKLVDGKVEYVKKRKITVFDVVNYSVLGLFALICILPIVYLLLLSFASKADYLQSNVLVIPRHFNFENYKVTLYQDNIFRAFGISVLVTVCSVVYSMVLTSLGAYAFTKADVPGIKIVFYIVRLDNVRNGATEEHRNADVLYEFRDHDLHLFHIVGTSAVVRTVRRRQQLVRHRVLDEISKRRRNVTRGEHTAQRFRSFHDKHARALPRRLDRGAHARNAAPDDHDVVVAHTFKVFGKLQHTSSFFGGFSADLSINTIIEYFSPDVKSGFQKKLRF